ncbi:MAG TPA: LPS export ABC transporter permease LptG [Candidatus Limnocylindria bacterium]|nr:LPS export ABC transporter permease LptG [Candidatus Limnocylindria bacterium]
MTPTARRFWAPTLVRYLRREVLRVVLLALVAFVALSLIGDFFDRVDTFLEHDASLGTILRSFLFRAPMVVVQVCPLAILAGTLIALGLMARHREIVALRACGISTWQIMAPLLAVAAVVSVLTLAWSEVVVPYSARRWHEIWTVEVKKNRRGRVFAGREIWYRGGAGFYNIGRASPGRGALFGLTVYQLDDQFRPTRLVVTPEATWTGDGWRLRDVETHELTPDGVRITPGAPPGFTLPETIDDFTIAELEPEAYGYRMLRRQIEGLRAKGVDTSESWVDLHLKLALPVASFIMMLIGVPLAIRGAAQKSIPAAVAIGFAVGFTYFMVLGFARALGQSGALPPLLAAWAGNGIFLLFGAYLVLGAD